MMKSRNAIIFNYAQKVKKTILIIKDSFFSGRIKTRIIAISILALGLKPTFATNYYFSQSQGNDSWSGRLQMPNSNRTDGPKRSINAFNILLNNSTVPGDSLFFMRNDRWNEGIGIQASRCQGSPQQAIFVGAYGNGAKPMIEKNGTGEILLCRGFNTGASSYLVFQNISLISRSPVGSRPVGVFINESFHPNKPHHISLDGLHISGCQSGMVLYQKNIRVENCLLEKNGNDNQGQGIFCSANEVEFRNNVLDSNGCGSVFVHSMYISHSSKVVFENNEIKNADDGLKLRACTDLLIRNNVIHNTYIHSIHLGGDEGSGTSNVIVEGNYLYDVPQGLRIGSESGNQTAFSEQIIVRNNIFPAQVTFTNNGPLQNVFFYNNTIHTANNQPALLLCDAIQVSNLQIKNNIFYKPTSQSNGQCLIWFNKNLDGIQIDHNLYYFPVVNSSLIRDRSTSFMSLDNFRFAYPAQETNGRIGNPQFVQFPQDLQLSMRSLDAIDKGADLRSFVDFDFNNRPRPIDGDGNGNATWDIGPFEYCCVSDIENESETSEILKIYPNPTQGKVIVHLKIPADLRVIHPNGQEIQKYSFLEGKTF